MPPSLLIEPYIGNGETLPVDYKLFVFRGPRSFCAGPSRSSDGAPLDRHGSQLGARLAVDARSRPARPIALDQLIAGAERLAQGHEFLRIDCYEVAGKPLFGEVTVYPGSGLLPIVPVSLDQYMGSLWRQAHKDLGAQNGYLQLNGQMAEVGVPLRTSG